MLLLLRAWATWGRHIRVLIVLVALFTIYAAATCAIGTWAVVSAGRMCFPRGYDMHVDAPFIAFAVSRWLPLLQRDQDVLNTRCP